VSGSDGPRLSVILCTHNPRADYLDRVLSALGGQTLDSCLWELVVVDNASDPVLTPDLGRAAHGAARTVREDVLGLVHARIRGCTEAASDLLVFVDDDNVLAGDYLERALRIADEWPHLGAWSGSLVPEFEVEPAPELTPYLSSLAIRQVQGDHWSNLKGWTEAVPFGAGMCVRRVVAARHAELIARDPIRQAFGTTAGGLMRGEDVDLAFTTVDVGLGMGVFESLVLTHLMPAGRVDPEYLLGLTESATYSACLLDFVHGLGTTSARRELKLRLAWIVEKLRHRSPTDRRFLAARERGRRQSARYIRTHGGRL
jgi:glycosyltransferase involved in cell wall biosynthesis